MEAAVPPPGKAMFNMRLVLGLSYMGMGQNPGTPGEHQNSWQMDVHPTKNVSIGIDPYPYLSVIMTTMMTSIIHYHKNYHSLSFVIICYHSLSISITTMVVVHFQLS